MTETKMIEEREAVMRERAAFRAGAERLWLQKEITGGPQPGKAFERVQSETDMRYPLPPIVLGKFAGREYRLNKGVLEYRTRAHSPVCDPPNDSRPLWDRASLQPEDVLYLADALQKVRDAI